MEINFQPFIQSEQFREYQKRCEFHIKLHMKLRKFIIEKGLESEFYEEYFPEADKLMWEWIESIERSKKLFESK